jgi:hypothetical protein
MNGWSEILAAIALVVGPVCAAGLSLAPSRRVALGLLLGVCVATGIGIALGQQLRIGLGLIATGVLTCGILAIGFERARWPRPTEAGGPIPGGRAFRAATVLLVAAAAWGIAAPQAASIAALPAPRLTAAVMIVAMGLLQLGLSQEQGAAAVGLLTALVGFEVFYSALEPSLALRAVLAGIMLGIALISSVLLEESAVASRDRRAG